MIELTITMESESQAGVQYECRRHTDGGYSCSCPNWVARSGGRGTGFKCKHLAEALDRGLFLLEEAAEPLAPPAAPLPRGSIVTLCKHATPIGMYCQACDVGQPAAAGVQQRPQDGRQTDPAAASAGPATDIIDGWLVDTRTGEQLAPAKLADIAVKDDGSAERVLAEFQVLEAERVALRQRLNGFKEWGDGESKKIDTREQALRRRFAPQLESFVRDRLGTAKGRKKSLSTPYGTIGFRTQPKSVEVADEAKALDWARFGCPDAVKTTVVEKLDKKALGQVSAELPADIFTVHDPVERFYIKANVAGGAEAQEAAAS